MGFSLSIHTLKPFAFLAGATLLPYFTLTLGACRAVAGLDELSFEASTGMGGINGTGGILASSTSTGSSSSNGSGMGGSMNAGPICGNGILETSEECDDGNTQDGDLCASNCLCGFDQLDPKTPGAAFVDASQSSCYLLFTQTQTFDNAEQVCMSKSMHLATITTLKELELLHPFIEAFTQVWIGGRRAVSTLDIWTWTSGDAWAIQPCEVNTVPACNNGMILWAIGEPNNSTGSEDCVEIYNGSALGFNDSECSALQPFVCERPLQLGM